MGDVSWHHGWTLHAAGPQPADSPPRLALSLTYIADGTRLLPRKTLQQRVHGEDRWAACCLILTLPESWPQAVSSTGEQQNHEQV